jgi:Sulfite exporter TauE/SafE
VVSRSRAHARSGTAHGSFERFGAARPLRSGKPDNCRNTKPICGSVRVDLRGRLHLRQFAGARLYLLLFGLRMRQAVGTSLLVIAVLSIPMLATHWALGHIDWAVAVAFAVGLVLASFAGARLSSPPRGRRAAPRVRLLPHPVRRAVHPLSSGVLMLPTLLILADRGPIAGHVGALPADHLVGSVLHAVEACEPQLGSAR